MNIGNLLNEAIENGFQQLGGMDPKSDEYKTTAEVVTKLVDRSIEMDKFHNECEEKAKTRELEQKDRMIRNGISIAGIAVPVMVTIWGTIKSLKFEETGTVTTIIGRGFINKLLPKK